MNILFRTRWTARKEAARTTNPYHSSFFGSTVSQSTKRMNSTLVIATKPSDNHKGFITCSNGNHYMNDPYNQTRHHFPYVYLNRRHQSNNSASSNPSDAKPISHRSEFQQIPVNPSILTYIRRIGVGIPKRNRNPNRRRGRRRHNHRQDFDEFSDFHDNEVMSRDEEIRSFGYGMNGNRSRYRKGTTRDGTHQNTNLNGRSTNDTNNQPLPPLPFGGPHHRQRTTTSSDGLTINQVQTEIKILGSVGAPQSSATGVDQHPEDSDTAMPSNDIHITATTNHFPRPSKTIPEVAIIGRSNVGKSTLLNALLYSEAVEPIGQVDDGSSSSHHRHRRHRRRPGLTTQTAKLPRGVKARTSSRPGETREITFYQLSARQRPRQQRKPEREGRKQQQQQQQQKQKQKPDQMMVTGKSEIDGRNNDDGQDENDSKWSTTSTLSPNSKPLSLMLVDLPGYGFAYGSGEGGGGSGGGSNKKPHLGDTVMSAKSESAPWQIPLIEQYLLERPRSSLKRILLLIDARHGIKKADIDFLESLQDSAAAVVASNDDSATTTTTTNRSATLTSMDEDGGDSMSDETFGKKKSNVTSTLKSSSMWGETKKQKKSVQLPPIQIVLTKCDLISQADLARRVVLVRSQLSECLRRETGSLPVMMVSAQMKGQAGVIELQRELAALVVGRRM